MRGKDNHHNYSLRLKLISIFICTSLLVVAINILLYVNLKGTIDKIDTAYASNEELNELSDCLNKVEKKVHEYLMTKSSQSLEDYYRYEQKYRILLEDLNKQIIDSPVAIAEKNIYNMSLSYLKITEEAVTAKRARNVQKYNETHTEGAELYEKIDQFIWELNNKQIQYNSENYKTFRETLNELVKICGGILSVILAANVFFIFIMTKSITKPMKELAAVADKVAGGDFEIRVPFVDTKDELGITARAFNKMIESIRNYIEQTKENYERESRLLENELIMKNELKDAQLKYLQAQINPHFLFNSLNAGAQLAMMEGAEKTCLFVENMADFFRYNVKTINTETTIREELNLVDNYIYILNVRFSGEIHYEKQLDMKLLDVRIPSMILQPLVENAVNHGIRGVEWEGHIWLSVYKEKNSVCISIRDNGHGMDKETIEKIMSGEPVHSTEDRTSTGIGMQNVVSRLKRFFCVEEVIQISSEGSGKGTELIISIPF